MPRRPLLPLLALPLVVLALSSCDPCRRFAKGKTMADKDSAAFCYIERGMWSNAAIVLEELRPYYRGQPREEAILYHFALAKYHQGEYIMAAYYFDLYAQQYPSGDSLRPAEFRRAECYDLQSAKFELDQTETNEALDYYSIYMRKYPGSSQAMEAATRVQNLNNRLAKKDYHKASLFHKIGHFRAAVITYQNVLRDWPEAPYREELLYNLFRAQASYADNSVMAKMEERYLEAIGYYLRFINQYPNSPYARQAESAYTRVQDQLGKLRAGEKVKVKKKDQADDDAVVDVEEMDN